MQHKDALLADLQVSACLGQSQRAAARLLASYEDRDGSLREEVAAIEGHDAAESSAPTDVMASFYRRLGDLREYHRRFPATPEDVAPVASADAAAAAVLDTFSPDELYGRYIDLAAPFEEWCNLPGVKDARMAAGGGSGGSDFESLARSDLIGYLRRFSDAHTGLPAATTHSRRFHRYVASLVQTLLLFVARAQPLLDLRSSVLAYVRAACDATAAAAARDVPAPPAASGSAPAAGPLVDLATFADAGALAASLGSDGLAAQLRARGLKAGGSLEERASRLWSVRGMQPHEYPKRLLAPAAAPAPPQAGGAAAGSNAAPLPSQLAGAAPVRTADPPPLAPGLPEGASSVLDIPDASAVAVGVLGGAEALRGPAGQQRLAAVLSDLVVRLASDVLDVPIRDAARRLERRLTKTRAELEAERLAAEAEVSAPVPGAAATGAGGDGAAADDDDEDKPIYNPKKLPLGWDGKPMPYWLWKLQGLNIEYRCEICGDAVIMGRRNFDRHFQEARHAYGMRCLGIPNTKHFHDVVRIEDARRLYDKLRSQLAAEVFVAGNEEEWEDERGNVLTRQAYEGALRSGMQQQR